MMNLLQFWKLCCAKYVIYDLYTVDFIVKTGSLSPSDSFSSMLYSSSNLIKVYWLAKLIAPPLFVPWCCDRQTAQNSNEKLNRWHKLLFWMICFIIIDSLVLFTSSLMVMSLRNFSNHQTQRWWQFEQYFESTAKPHNLLT